MAQAIMTKYLGPTNRLGARVKAYCYAGSVTIPFPHECNTMQAHNKAAKQLAEKLGWGGYWVAGASPEKNIIGYAFVPIHIPYGQSPVEPFPHPDIQFATEWKEVEWSGMYLGIEPLSGQTNAA